MLTIGSLFSGIGGLELGLEWAGLGPVLWQVEADTWCREVLAEHWPHVERFRDVRSVSARELARVDLVCGGFPCQDVSSAGPRVGLGGARSGLWYEFDRIVGELRPPWVVVENVTSGAARWVDAVRGCLEGRGYASLPIPLAARDRGAPHNRERVVIVARVGDALREQRKAGPEAGEPPRGPAAAAPGAVGYARSDGAQARSCGRAQRSRSDARGALADSDGGALRQSEQRDTRRHDAVRDRGRAESRHAGERGGRLTQPVVDRGAHGLSARLDRAAAHARPVRWPSGRGEPQASWEPSRAVPGSLDVERAIRLHGLGNAVVPHCAEVVGHVIRLLMQAP